MNILIDGCPRVLVNDAFEFDFALFNSFVKSFGNKPAKECLQYGAYG